MTKKLSEILENDFVYFVLRRPAFVTNQREYQVSAKSGQSHGYSQVVRAFGKVLNHDQVGKELRILPSFEMDYDCNRPEYPVVIPYWCLRKLLWWNGGWTDSYHKLAQENTSTVFNRLRMALMRRRVVDIEQKAGRPPLRTFEEVTLWV